MAPLPHTPCHSTVNPPHCRPRSCAAGPVTRIRAPLSSGSTPSSFFSSTSDFRTASRATARCSTDPKLLPFDALRAHGRGAANRPARELGPQDPCNRIVDTPARDDPALHLPLQPGDELAPGLRHHEHVDPGVHGHRGGFRVIVSQRIDPVPVRDHEPAETHLLLQHLLDEVPVRVALLAVPAAQRHHDGQDSGLQRRRVGRNVEAPQLLLAPHRVPLVHPGLSPSVPHPVLGAGDDSALLQPPDDPPRILGHQSRILRVALVGAPPARVARHGEGGREGPVDPRGTDLPRRHASDPLDQLGIPRRPQPDVVRKHCRAPHVGVPVDRINPVEDRDRHVVPVLLHRHGPVGVVHRHPVGGAVVAGAGTAAAQHRADVETLRFAGADVEPFRLRHLPDLLIERHARDDLPDALPGRGCAPAHSG